MNEPRYFANSTQCEGSPTACADNIQVGRGAAGGGGVQARETTGGLCVQSPQ